MEGQYAVVTQYLSSQEVEFFLDEESARAAMRPGDRLYALTPLEK